MPPFTRSNASHASAADIPNSPATAETTSGWPLNAATLSITTLARSRSVRSSRIVTFISSVQPSGIVMHRILACCYCFGIITWNTEVSRRRFLPVSSGAWVAEKKNYRRSFRFAMRSIRMTVVRVTVWVRSAYQDNRMRYGQRCSSSAFKAAQVTPSRRSWSSEARRWSSSARCAAVSGRWSSSRLSQSCEMSARRSGGVRR